jgi:thymidylate synthase (FAD)
MGTDLSVARAAWVSTKGERAEDENNPDKVKGVINHLAKNKHSSPFEHVVATFRIKVPLFVMREHHRHRTFSYNEESGRYKVLQSEFYIPDKERAVVETGKVSSYKLLQDPDLAGLSHDIILQQSREAYEHYQSLLDQGVAKEVARMVLPVNIMSTCYVTGNLRNYMHFIGLRSHPTAQYEIRQVSDAYLEQLKELFPIATSALEKYTLQQE